jgi:hypothetical protein
VPGNRNPAPARSSRARRRNRTAEKRGRRQDLPWAHHSSPPLKNQAGCISNHRRARQNFPHPAKPCLQSCHPAKGYAARRGSRAGSALVVREGRAPSPQGPAENGLPPATRGKRQGIGPTPVVSRPKRRAGCACAAHKGAGSGGCVGIVRRDGSSPERRQTLSVGKVLKARSCTAKNRNGPSRKPAADIHGLRPLQRDRSRRQKPLNGALRGVTYTNSYEAAPSAPSNALANPRAEKPPRGYLRWRDHAPVSRPRRSAARS